MVQCVNNFKCMSTQVYQLFSVAFLWIWQRFFWHKIDKIAAFTCGWRLSKGMLPVKYFCSIKTSFYGTFLIDGVRRDCLHSLKFLI